MKHLPLLALLLTMHLLLPGKAASQCSFNPSAIAFPACFGSSNGSIDLSVSGSTPPFTYIWSNGSTTQDLSNIPAGTYTATITESGGCTMTMSGTVTEAQQLIAQAAPGGILTCSDQLVQLGGPNTTVGPTIIYNWTGPGINPGNFSQRTPVVSLPGQYTLVVTETVSGCTASDVVIVSADYSPPVVNAGNDRELTCVSPTIELSASWTGVGGAPLIEWITTDGIFSSSTNQATVTVNAPGHYTVIVTNPVNGCSDSDEVVVTANFTSPVANAGEDKGLSCTGDPVQLNASGSSQGSQYVFMWTGPGINASTQFLLNPLISIIGVYTLIVTDATNGCTDTDEVLVFAGPAIPAQNFVLTHPDCSIGVLGAIDMTVDFGTGPYSIKWSNGATTEDLTNLTSGVYQVSVTDATGCTYYAAPSLELMGSTLNLFLTVHPVTCFGTGNGSIDLDIFGGTAPLSAAWTGPSGYSSTLEDISNLTPGNYSVTVTDATGCTASRIENIATASAMNLPPNNIFIQQIGCPGASDGGILIGPMGGLSPYTFDWSNDGPENPDNDPQNVFGLSAGLYTVTITDRVGCSLVSPAIQLVEPAAVQVNAVVTHDPCEIPGNLGAIDLTALGGVLPLTFGWSTGWTTPDINNLAAGTYTVTITQNNGCSSTYSVTVLNGGMTIPATDFTVTPASCVAGAADGAITLSVLPSAAQPPYNFQWTGPNGFTASSQDISGLPTGQYSLTLTEGGGCQYIAQIFVDLAPGNFDISLSSPVNNCNEATVEVIVTGGIAPYEYFWSNGASGSPFSYSISGTYTVWVTDNLGCTKSATMFLNAPEVLVVTSTITPVMCFGENNGAIDLQITTGTGPYSFAWSNGDMSEDLANLTAGTYAVTVTDESNGCTAYQFYGVSQPPPFLIQVTGTTQPICFNSTTGAAEIVFTGGVDPPFFWNLQGPQIQSGNTVENQLSLSNLSAGGYSLTITNNAGCSASTGFALTSLPPLTAVIEELSNSCQSALLQATVVGGVPPYTFSWEGPVTILNNTNSIEAPVSGLYQVLVMDAAGCGDFALYDVSLANGGNCGYLRGFVRVDENDNCIAVANEPPLGGWLVRAEGLDTLYGLTDTNGRYLIAVPTGSYQMKVIPPNNLWLTCPMPPVATVNISNDTVFGGNFPMRKLKECPLLSVSIGTNQLRRCFSNNYYQVAYKNEGTVVAEDVYIDVALDPFIDYLSSSVLAVSQGNNVWRFVIGDLAVGQFGAFNIRVNVKCSATLGQTHCTEAHIYPDTICNASAQWSGADLRVNSVCNGDSLRFVVENAGSAAMTTAVDYIVVEDAVMFKKSPLPLLPAGGSMEIAVPANGSTWYMEVGQEAFHPFPQPVGLAVEGCANSSSFSTGFVNQFALNDSPPSVDIDCTANIGSYDPNDKQGYPTGYGADHDVRPGTEIEYRIRFQNTGTDTAFTVRIVDTLSAWLDPATIKFGVTSHPCRFDLSGEGVVQFIFDQILLPDSNINEPASHGFATFRILPKPEAPLQSVIHNRAAIYFDFNDPVYTNTTAHRINENFILVKTWIPESDPIRIAVSPNPFNDQTTLTLAGLQGGTPLRLQVFDSRGIEVGSMETTQREFHLKKGEWQAGVYYFRISMEDKLLGSGTLLVQ